MHRKWMIGAYSYRLLHMEETSWLQMTDRSVPSPGHLGTKTTAQTKVALEGMWYRLLRED